MVSTGTGASTRADAVVIGGGIAGACTGLHLLREGAGDVVVVERDGAGQGTTAAGAGMVGTLAAGYADQWAEEELAAEYYGLDFYAELAERYDFGYRKGGMLWLARDEDAWVQLQSLVNHPAVPEKRVVEPAEIDELCAGVVNPDAVVRGIFHPNDVQVSAGAAARAVVAQFVAEGGRFEERTPVRGLTIEHDRVTAVQTLRETIATDTVVVAAGAWTNALLAPHDLFVPMVPRVATRQITPPQGIPPTIPNILLAGWAADGRQWIWLREEQGGLLWGLRYDGNPRDAFVDAPVPERFDQISLDGLNESRRWGLPAAVAVPALASEHITVAHGAPCYTPDVRAMVGQVPGASGLFVLSGDNETGVTRSPGWSRALAELIVGGAAKLTDLSVWDPGRFPELRTPREVRAALQQWRPPVGEPAA